MHTEKETEISENPYHNYSNKITYPLSELEIKFHIKFRKKSEHKVPFIKEFLHKIGVETLCECWFLTKDWSNYSQFKGIAGHRLSFEIFNGPIGLYEVCHKCDRPGCVNPEHLFLGTHSENMNDSFRKCRSPKDLNYLYNKKKYKSVWL